MQRVSTGKRQHANLPENYDEYISEKRLVMNTDYCKVTAIIRCEVLEKVEQRLQELGVSGISVTRVKGYGDYANFL